MPLFGFFIMPSFQTNLPRAAIRLSTLALLIPVTLLSTVRANARDQDLPPVVVTASRIEQPQTDALPHTTVITAEDIRERQPADLLSLLRSEAGIQFTQNGGPGQTSSLFMRGATPGEALILIDGVPVRRQGFAPAPALEHILPQQIDHIEIVRGNVSAIYGSSAVGGVIQIFTRQGAGKPAATLSAEAGSRGTRQLSGALSGKSGDTRYALSVTRFRTDGFSANNTAQYPNENPDKDGDRNTSFAGNVSHEWAKGHEIGARAYADDGRFQFDGGGSGAVTDVNEGQSKQHSLAVFSKDRLLPNWLSTLTLSQTATRDDSRSVAASGYTIRSNSDATLLQWANEVSLSPDWTLVAGMDAGREKLDAFSDYGFGAAQNAYHRSTSSIYAGLNGKIDAHQWQLNVRRDHVGSAGSDLSAYLGYGYALTRSVKLIASASSAFNAPTLAQLFDPLSGNPALRAEKSRSYEVGAQYALGTAIVRATLFKTKTKDQFSVDPNNCFSGAYPASCPTFNLAKADNQGVELSASGQLAGIDAHASLTYQEPKDDATGQLLIRRARTLASLGLSRSFGAWNVGGDLQYAGSRPDTDFSTGEKKKLASYWLANFTVRRRISRKISVHGRIDNLFNRDYQTAYGYNQPPRGVFIGISWQP